MFTWYHRSLKILTLSSNKVFLCVFHFFFSLLDGNFLSQRVLSTLERQFTLVCLQKLFWTLFERPSPNGFSNSYFHSGVEILTLFSKKKLFLKSVEMSSFRCNRYIDRLYAYICIYMLHCPTATGWSKSWSHTLELKIPEWNLKAKPKACHKLP